MRNIVLSLFLCLCCFCCLSVTAFAAEVEEDTVVSIEGLPDDAAIENGVNTMDGVFDTLPDISTADGFGGLVAAFSSGIFDNFPWLLPALLLGFAGGLANTVKHIVSGV